MLLWATVKPFRVALVEPVAYLGDSQQRRVSDGKARERGIHLTPETARECDAPSRPGVAGGGSDGQPASLRPRQRPSLRATTRRRLLTFPPTTAYPATATAPIISSRSCPGCRLTTLAIFPFKAAYSRSSQWMGLPLPTQRATSPLRPYAGSPIRRHSAWNLRSGCRESNTGSIFTATTPIARSEQARSSHSIARSFCPRPAWTLAIS